jgi:hypothetical protein
MRRTHIRPVTLALALALLPLAGACSSDTVAPLPVRTGAPATSATTGAAPATGTGSAAGPTTSTAKPRAGGTARDDRPARPAPTRTRTIRPTPDPGGTSTCRGAVRYDLNLHDNELALIKSMCFQAGGVLRLQGIGPGQVTVEPASLVSQNYEGGVVDVRFVRKGTVDVKIPQDDQVYTITVVIT